MPVTGIIMVGAVQDAATAEGIAPARVKQLMVGFARPDRAGFVAWVKDPANANLGTVEFKAAFPAQLGALSDAEASAVLRVAIEVAGGIAV